MTEKTEVINTRFSEKEKQTVEQYAAACGLTRSEYLRKRALGYEPWPALGDSFYQLYSKLCDLCNQSMTVETEKALLELITDIHRNLIAKRIAERSAPKVENLLAMERQQETEVTRGRMKGARHDERNKSRTFSR